MITIICVVVFLWSLGVLFVLSLTKAAQRADIMLDNHYHANTVIKKFPSSKKML